MVILGNNFIFDYLQANQASEAARTQMVQQPELAPRSSAFAPYRPVASTVAAPTAATIAAVGGSPDAFTFDTPRVPVIASGSNGSLEQPHGLGAAGLHHLPPPSPQPPLPAAGGAGTFAPLSNSILQEASLYAETGNASTPAVLETDATTLALQLAMSNNNVHGVTEQEWHAKLDQHIQLHEELNNDIQKLDDKIPQAQKMVEEGKKMRDEAQKMVEMGQKLKNELSAQRTTMINMRERMGPERDVFKQCVDVKLRQNSNWKANFEAMKRQKDDEDSTLRALKRKLV